MKKFLFFIILMPTLLALGHDVYIFAQDPSKGFRFSDIGALWDKYHKESHDQWRSKIHEIGSKVDEILPIEQVTEPDQESEEQSENAENGNENLPDYMESFTLKNNQNEEPVVMPVEEDKIVEIQANRVQSLIGFLLEQSAVATFGLFAFTIFFMNALLSWMFRKKSSMEKLDKHKKMKAAKKMKRMQKKKS